MTESLIRGSHWPEGGLHVSILGSPESEAVQMAWHSVQEQEVSTMGSFNDLFA